MVFTIFGGLFVKKSKIYFLLAAMKSLTKCEKPSSNSLRRACSSFAVAAWDAKSCSKSLKIVPKGGRELYTGENRPMSAKETRNKNVMPLSEQFL
jgi:hypothetical protein